MVKELLIVGLEQYVQKTIKTHHKVKGGIQKLGGQLVPKFG